jgi:hypothetical protein
MKYNTLNIALVLFVLSTTIILGSTTNAYAVDSDGRGDSGVGHIEACLNAGQPPNFWPCDTDEEWKGGNITNDAGYREGSSIPVRIDITGLENDTAGVTYHGLAIEWDITKTQNNTVKHTFDYITQFDRNDDPHPCLIAHNSSELEVCENWVSATKPIPRPSLLASTTNGTNSTTTLLPQPRASFDMLNQTEGEQEFYMFVPAGESVFINSIYYLSEGDPSFAGGNTESTTLFVNYTTSSSEAIAAFGAHVASPDDWDWHAVDVNGKSFQIACDEVHAKGGCSGGQINLDAFDVIFPLTAPEITLKKFVNLTNGGNATADNWLLTADHPQNGARDIQVSGSNTQPFLADIGVEYTLSEELVAGGPTGFITADPSGRYSCSINNQTATLNSTITLSANDKAICTIENIFDNVPPVANDQDVITAEDTAVEIILNGTDVNPNTLTYSIETNSTNGLLTNFNSTSGEVTYTPNGNFTGSDNFTFSINDGIVDSNIATVSISVTPVNDVPVAVDDFAVCK